MLGLSGERAAGDQRFQFQTKVMQKGGEGERIQAALDLHLFDGALDMKMPCVNMG